MYRTPKVTGGIFSVMRTPYHFSLFPLIIQKARA